ncbi:uncharacterized protein FFM5_15059 [Fusarium fujikuroi]|nr:uncharacterized protein FFM5_15059 [Fusarium fujikuroi]
MSPVHESPLLPTRRRDESINTITRLHGSGKPNILDATCFVLGITNMPIVQASKGRELLFPNGSGKSNIGVMASRQGLQQRCILVPEDEQTRDCCSHATGSGGRGDDGILCQIEITPSQVVITSTTAIAAGLEASTDKHICRCRDCLEVACLRSWERQEPSLRYPQTLLEILEDAAAVQEATRLDLGPYTLPSPIKAACKHHHSTPYRRQGSQWRARFVSPSSNQETLHSRPLFLSSSFTPKMPLLRVPYLSESPRIASRTTTSIVTYVAETAADAGTS